MGWGWVEEREERDEGGSVTATMSKRIERREI